MKVKVKALVNFAGKVSMHKNEIRELKNKVIVDDLLKAGYVEKIEKPKKSKKKGES